MKSLLAAKVWKLLRRIYPSALARGHTPVRQSQEVSFAVAIGSRQLNQLGEGLSM
jgi:hypothetical protein